ncbi:DUF3152 domain-containing protein [Nocardioides sp. C4-1]|uniref:DUF3152 domain-containing protein n=1 Tax=Nocardioides sp. C4-1 TaxID=3151851 RepID=UPI003266A021
MRTRWLLALVVAVLPLLGPGVVPTAAAAVAPVATAPPAVSGRAVFGEVLTAVPGTWSPSDVVLSYRWLRGGRPVAGATTTTYRLAGADVGYRVQVEVTATAGDGTTGRAVSAPGARVAAAPLLNRKAPRIVGSTRYGGTLRARPGRWSTSPDRVRYQWLRGGRPVRGATGPRYAVRPDDVGRKIRVEVTARARHHRPGTARSTPVRAKHRVGVRRTVTYSVVVDGRVRADVGEFRRQAQQTFDDARGWRGTGVVFRPVGSGGSFTLVLAEAGRVPSYSSGCSATWSCRVGRWVIINQDRWLGASPAWNAAGESRRDYRHMVVNHETGHWLGKGHAGCPRPGALAPVMQQQSKGTQGCRLNPWPTPAELR